MIPPGRRHSVRLCATFVRTVNVPGGRYGDGYGGHGLSLLVTPRKSGGLSKTWAQAIVMPGIALAGGFNACLRSQQPSLPAPGRRPSPRVEVRRRRP